MKKLLFILGLILSFKVYGANECGDDLNNNCWDCGATDEDLCTAVLEGTKLTITGSGEMVPYNADNGTSSEYDFPPWPKSITEVEISGVKSIQQGAFYDFDNLEKVTIGSDVGMIHWYTFTGCEKLSEVIFSDTVFGIGNFAFANDKNLKKLVIPESLFFNSSNGLHWPFPFGYKETWLEELYCPQGHESECQYALQTSGMEDEKINEVLKIYEKYGDEYYVDGRFYEKPQNIGTSDYIKKRIYTIDEANKVVGKVNSFKIRYR